MNYQVTEVQFDFEDEENLPPSQLQQSKIVEETIGQIWEADDEEDLVEEITCATGYCIKSLNYVHVLK